MLTYIKAAVKVQTSIADYSLQLSYSFWNYVFFFKISSYTLMKEYEYLEFRKLTVTAVLIDNEHPFEADNIVIIILNYH